MTIQVGDRLPDVSLRLVAADGPKVVTTRDFFAGRKIALFGLPGAFTGTCSKSHLPGFIAHEAALKAKGVDAIAETSVNDHHVLAAWAKASGADGKIDFLADGNADFAKALGFAYDASEGGMGTRSRRYAMLVDDGVVRVLNIEPGPGIADVSSAANLLKAL
jgi:peroxiredoxin